jgi:hypothetical protein
MPRGGMRPGKKLLGGHAERVCDARFVAARLQPSISHWEFLGSGLTQILWVRGVSSEESLLGDGTPRWKPGAMHFVRLTRSG